MRLLLIGPVLLSVAAWAQDVSPQTWQSLLHEGKRAEAEQLCTEWTRSSVPVEEAEGHRCLASVALGGGHLQLQGSEGGGGEGKAEYSAQQIDSAVAHLNRAVQFAPQDLSIHQDRLYVLEVSGRYTAMASALDESCQIYTGRDGLTAWMAYPEQLSKEGQVRAALGLAKVLEKHFPDSAQVIGNIGAFYTMLKENEKALPYLQKAVALEPSDPIDNWNLARIYDLTGRVAQANEQYQKAMRLEFEPEQQKQNSCIYGKFLETKMHDRPRACELERSGCAPQK